MLDPTGLVSEDYGISSNRRAAGRLNGGATPGAGGGLALCTSGPVLVTTDRWLSPWPAAHSSAPALWVGHMVGRRPALCVVGLE